MDGLAMCSVYLSIPCCILHGMAGCSLELFSLFLPSPPAMHAGCASKLHPTNLQGRRTGFSTCSQLVVGDALYEMRVLVVGLSTAVSTVLFTLALHVLQTGSPFPYFQPRKKSPSLQQKASIIPQKSQQKRRPRKSHKYIDDPLKRCRRFHTCLCPVLCLILLSAA